MITFTPMNDFFKSIIIGFVLLFSLEIIAQPTLSIEDVTVPSGSLVALSVSVKDFTDITKAQFSLNWDPTQLEFVSIKNINATENLNLDINNFDLSKTDEGHLVFLWEDVPGFGVTVEDDMVLFEIEIRVHAPEGQTSFLNITNNPVEIIINRNASGTANIFDPNFVNNSTLTVIESVPETIFTLKEKTDIYCPGDQVCYDMEIQGFDSILALTFALAWDSTILQYDRVENFGFKELNETYFNVNCNDTTGKCSNEIRVSWSGETFETLTNGVSVEDGSTLFTICYNIIGKANEQTDIVFEDSVLPLEAVNKNGESLNFIPNGVSVRIDDCDELVIFQADCTDGAPGDTICIAISTLNFSAISHIEYILNWNTEILEFLSVENFNLPNLDETNFNPSPGSLVIDWTGDSEVSLENNTSLYQVCFAVKETAEIGKFSFINFLELAGTFQVLDKDGNELNDVRFRSCDVKVLAPNVKLSGEQITTIPGTSFCMPVSVDNFFNITSFEIPIEWDPAVLEFTGVQDFNLEGLDQNNFSLQEADQGKIQLALWRSPDENGRTLPDGTVIFSICFDIIGELGTASPISFSENVANPAFFVNTEGQVEADITNGEIRVESAGIVLNTEEMVVAPNEGFCHNFTVDNFEAILSMNYTHAWDASILRFDSVANIQLVGLDATTSFGPEFPEDFLTVNWLSNDPINGETLSNGSLIYQLCFTPIGDLGTCANLTLSDAPIAPEVITANSQGADIGIFNNVKDVCITDFGVINERISHPSCDGNDGLIRLDVEGGSGSYLYLWQKNGAQIENDETNDSINLNGLEGGEYCLTIIDKTNASKNLSKCYTIDVVDEGTPIPNAGEDLDLGCIDAAQIEVALDASKSLVPEGGVFTYEWKTPDGQIRPFDETKENPIITATGTYILTIHNISNNCSASDTVLVFSSEPPIIKIEAAGNLDCANEVVRLNAEETELKENMIFTWTTEGGSFASDSTTLSPAINREGTYQLTVIDTTNNCTAIDEISIIKDIDPPRAEAGPDRELRCEDDFITLNGEGSSTGNGVVYEWSTIDGSSIVNFDQLQADVSRVGSYYLTVINMINGCQATDTMIVNADESLPVAKVPQKAIIGCGMNEIILDGSASSQGNSFAYEWEGPLGEPISTQPSIMVEETGQYLLVVTNIDNDDCIADTAVVVVSKDNTIPAASITQNLTIGCDIDCKPLTANAEEGDQFTYKWITEEGRICGGENTPEAMVGAIGLYKFIITNTENNCSDTSSTFVLGDGDAIIADAGPIRQLDCLKDTAVLDGRGSTINDQTLFEWYFEEDILVSTDITVTVTDTGEYKLIVTDTLKNCAAISHVSVFRNEATPKADAGNDLEVPGCEFPEGLRLSGANSDNGTNISYNWEASEGGEIVGDPASINPEIGSPGTYTLTVLNNENGCSSMASVVISSNVLIPTARAGEDQTLSCIEPTVSLGDTMVLPMDGLTIQWTTVDGNIVSGENNLVSIVNAPGTYTLTISSQDGCLAKDEVIVSANLDMPIADAGEDLAIACNTPTNIDASNSSFGENILVEWTTIDGNIISGADGLNPQINKGGTYQLTITNTLSNCIATDKVIVASEDNLPLAEAGTNQETCGNETFLNAVPVIDGIIGVWTTLEKSMILDPTNPGTAIADLEEGINTYVWTLSTEACPNYSADTTLVIIPSLPTAQDDAFDIPPGQNISVLDLTSNDQINFESFVVNITNQPRTGSLSEINGGIFEFTVPARYFGTQEFQYEVCNTTCSNLCDVATVRVVVRPGADVDTTNTRPNAITPNGDGLNDFLMFEELIFDSQEFPNSELTIFNRWGDIIYKAHPYHNDWDGRSNTGEKLPQGTYYYILRLDISEGEIMRGDITILR